MVVTSPRCKVCMSRPGDDASGAGTKKLPGAPSYFWVLSIRLGTNKLDSVSSMSAFL